MNKTKTLKDAQLESILKKHYRESAIIDGNIMADFMIPLRPTVENLGLNWSGQLKRLKRAPFQTYKWEERRFVSKRGKMYKMVCMDPINFQKWLYNLNSFSPNFDIELWHQYKQNLVIQLISKSQFPLNTIKKLKKTEKKYKALKKGIREYFSVIEESEMLNKTAEEKERNSEYIKKNIQKYFKDLEAKKKGAPRQRSPKQILII